MKREIDLREAKRNCYCRGCDVVIQRGETMIATYSSRNTGQYIYFCIDCVKEMNKLINN